jgi:PAS domain-containing protein
MLRDAFGDLNAPRCTGLLALLPEIRERLNTFRKGFAPSEHAPALHLAQLFTASGEAPMAHPIQIILTRQLAGYLSVPFFLVDPEGNLLFYNEPAEIILGKRFDETGAMTAAEWSSVFIPLDEQRKPMPPAELPLRIALAEKRPAYRRLYIQGLNGLHRYIEVAAIPIVGLEGELLGAAALFWELPP